MRVLLVIYLFLTLAGNLSAGVHPAGRTETALPQKQPSTPEAEISVVGNRLKVENALVGSKLEIYSIVGIKVLEIEIKYSTGDYPLNIAKGYYIVRLDETVRKIVVR